MNGYAKCRTCGTTQDLGQMYLCCHNPLLEVIDNG